MVQEQIKNFVNTRLYMTLKLCCIHLVVTRDSWGSSSWQPRMKWYNHPFFGSHSHHWKWKVLGWLVIIQIQIVEYCYNTIKNDIVNRNTMTEPEYKSEFVLEKTSPYLVLTGELWSVYCEDFVENWLCYNRTALYEAFILVNWSVGVLVSWIGFSLFLSCNPGLCNCFLLLLKNKTFNLTLCYGTSYRSFVLFLRLQKKNIDHTLKLQKTPHSSSSQGSYGVSAMYIREKLTILWYCVIMLFDHIISVLYYILINQTERSCQEIQLHVLYILLWDIGNHEPSSMSVFFF